MTRSITIINTSNWKDEDYMVDTPHGRVYLRPGESLTMTPPEASLDVPVHLSEPGKPEPFIDKDEGVQLTPHVHVTMRGGKRDGSLVSHDCNKIGRTIGG